MKHVRRAPPTAGPPVALYVHIPFCVSLCPYCDFVVFAGAAARGPRARVDAFLDALHAELDLRADALDDRFGMARPALDSVYLGGGTPSLLPSEAVAAILDHVRHRYGVAPGAEITLEANPGPDEQGDMIGFASAGVTRVSLGAQSLNDGELRRLGRRHRAVDVESAVRAARAGGIGSVSLDLLYDVPDWLVRHLDGHPRARAGARDRPPVAVRADPRRPRRRRADRPRRRPPADDRRRAAVAGTRPARPGRRPGRHRVRPRRPASRRGRLARVRDQQLGTAGTREPSQPRVLAAPVVRGGRTGGACIRWPDPALERRPSRRLPRRPDPGRRRAAEPATGRVGGRSIPRRRPSRRSSWASGRTAASRSKRPAGHRSTAPSSGRSRPISSRSPTTIGSS